MTNVELRAVLARANLSQRQMAKMLEIDERTMRRYCLAEYAIPTAIKYAVLWLIQNMESTRTDTRIGR